MDRIPDYESGRIGSNPIWGENKGVSCDSPEHRGKTVEKNFRKISERRCIPIL